MPPHEPEPAAPAAQDSRSWLGVAKQEVRERPMAYLVLVAFVIAGPVVTHYLFPQAPTGVGFFGGLAFGVYAALCAMPGRFL